MAMHSNWNPWHGCKKCSEGCQNCYVYYLDRMRGKDGADVYKTKTGFRYPLSKDKNRKYKIQSGEMISVCMTSDFFPEEADSWRGEAWDIIRQRGDVTLCLPESLAAALFSRSDATGSLKNHSGTESTMRLVDFLLYFFIFVLQ